MKDGVILLILGVLVIGGVLLWQSHVVPFHLELPPITKTESQAAEPAAPPSKPVISRPKAAAAAPVADIDPVAEATAAEPETIPAAIPLDPPPFPAVGEIPSGVSGNEVTTKFGDPALSTLTSSNGRILRTYVYTRDKGRQTTVIELEDGKVSSAYSTTAPAPPPGLSIPRQKRTE